MVSHRVGAGAAYVRLRKPAGALILMYHSVSRRAERPFIEAESTMAAEDFEAQARFLARHRKVVSLSALVEALEEGRTLPGGTVAITFDDGYRDVREVAAPILERYQLPATLYLATGYVERAENQWVDQLIALFSRRTRNTVETPDGRRFILARPDQLREAYVALHGALLGAGSAARRALLETLAAQLRPAGAVPRLTLTWDEVRALVRQYPGFEIGVHSREHVDLAQCDPDTARQEVDACVADVERELGFSPRHFSYPYGRYSAVAAQRVRERGLRSAAVTTPAALVGPETDRFALPRLEAPRDLTLLRHRTSGAYPVVPEGLWQAIRAAAQRWQPQP